MTKKTNHNPPKQPKPTFIKFSKIQKNYLQEVRNRQVREFNEAVLSVCEELGIKEKVLQATPGTYRVRPDISGLDVLPTKSESSKDK